METTEAKVLKTYQRNLTKHNDAIKAAWYTCREVSAEASAKFGEQAGTVAFLGTGEFLAKFIGYNLVTLESH